MGITPGGATPASFMSYGLAKRFSKNGDNFGKGEIEGVVAPETAAHAAGTSALLPMLTLGIPGSPTAAVLLGGLMIWGLQPGPMLFVEQKEFVWGLIASMYLGNIAGLIVVLTCVPLFAAILRVPFSIIAPVILVICAVGAYTVHNSHVRRVDDDGVRRHRLRVPASSAIRCRRWCSPSCSATRPRNRSGRRCSARQGSLAIFWSNWLVGTIMTLGMILLFWPLITWLMDKRRARSREPCAASGWRRRSRSRKHRSCTQASKAATKEETMQANSNGASMDEARLGRAHRSCAIAGARPPWRIARVSATRRPGSRPSPCSSSSPPAPAAAPTRWRASSRAWSPRTT